MEFVSYLMLNRVSVILEARQLDAEVKFVILRNNNSTTLPISCALRTGVGS